MHFICPCLLGQIYSEHNTINTMIVLLPFLQEFKDTVLSSRNKSLEFPWHSLCLTRWNENIPWHSLCLTRWNENNCCRRDCARENPTRKLTISPLQTETLNSRIGSFFQNVPRHERLQETQHMTYLWQTWSLWHPLNPRIYSSSPRCLVLQTQGKSWWSRRTSGNPGWRACTRWLSRSFPWRPNMLPPTWGAKREHCSSFVCRGPRLARWWSPTVRLLPLLAQCRPWSDGWTSAQREVSWYLKRVTGRIVVKLGGVQNKMTWLRGAWIWCCIKIMKHVSSSPLVSRGDSGTTSPLRSLPDKHLLCERTQWAVLQISVVLAWKVIAWLKSKCWAQSAEGDSTLSRFISHFA